MANGYRLSWGEGGNCAITDLMKSLSVLIY
jgi:hypothetical protein